MVATRVHFPFRFRLLFDLSTFGEVRFTLFLFTDSRFRYHSYDRNGVQCFLCRAVIELDDIVNECGTNIYKLLEATKIMTDRTIASRPSLEQVVAIVDFMEKHPVLGLSKLRGLEGRDQSKRLWAQLTRTVNSLSGPTRPVKSWIKYWADKKSTVRSKVVSSGGDPNNLTSNLEKKIWDLFLAKDVARVTKPRNTSKEERRKEVKQETHFVEENYFNEDSMDQDHIESEPVLAFEVPTVDTDARQMAIMEKLVKVMSAQAMSMTELANASQTNSQAIDRLAEASHLQARAVTRLATTFESLGSATHDVRNAIVDIDSTMKRYYATAPT